MGSVAVLYVTMLLFSLSVSSIGLMVSSFASTQQQAFLGCFTVGVPCILLSGFMTPINNMPMFLQDLSQLNPLRHFIVILQGLFLKDITMSAALDSSARIAAITAVSSYCAIRCYAQGIGPDTLRIDSGMAIKKRACRARRCRGPAKGVREARRR